MSIFIAFLILRILLFNPHFSIDGKYINSYCFPFTVLIEMNLSLLPMQELTHSVLAQVGKSLLETILE